jgi:hypothetical protein
MPTLRVNDPALDSLLLRLHTETQCSTPYTKSRRAAVKISQAAAYG